MKTKYRTLALQALLATAVIWGYSANAMATLIFTNQNSTANTAAFDGSISSTDLINQSTATFSSITGISGFVGGGIAANMNDGSGNTNFGGSPGTSYANFGATATFNLDISTNTQGYTITQINSFAGQTGWSTNYGNQYYDLEFQDLGGSWSSAITVNYQPFGTTVTPGTTASFVAMTDDSGTIATGVKAVRITIKNNSGHDGVMMKEFDVIGVPVPEPSSFAMLLFGSVMLWAVGRKKR